MKTKLFTVLALVMLFGVSPVRGEVWTEGYHQINPGDVYGEVDIYNSVTLDIFGGHITRLAAFDTTYTNWYDGDMKVLWVRDDSIVNIYGGDLDEMAAIENGQINLYAYDVVHTTTGGHYGIGQVMGYYLDDMYFCFDLGNLETYSHINVVPEPTTIILLGIGGILVIRRK